MSTRIKPIQDRLDEATPNMKVFMALYLNPKKPETFLREDVCFDIAYPRNGRSLVGGYQSGRDVLKSAPGKLMLRESVPSVEVLQNRLQWVIEEAVEANDLARVESAVMSMAKLAGYLKEINQNNTVIINQTDKEAIRELARQALASLPSPIKVIN